LADTSITMGTNATSCGRLLAGAVRRQEHLPLTLMLFLFREMHLLLHASNYLSETQSEQVASKHFGEQHENSSEINWGDWPCRWAILNSQFALQMIQDGLVV